MKEQIKEYKKTLTIGKLGFWEWDAITNKTYWGDEKFQLFGYEPQEFEVTFEKAFSTVHPDDAPMIMALLAKKMPLYDQFEYEYRGIHKLGHQINVWVRVEVIRDKKGNAIGISGTSQDITERKKLEEEILKINSSLESQIVERTKELKSKAYENELLLKEMHHRVKNNLQIISSILRLQKDYLKDKLSIATLDDCISRIISMAIIHESIYSSDNLASIDLKLYFQQLMHHHLNDQPNIKDTLDLPNVQLNICKMLPLGMIINELISNSIKHAFVQEKNPEIILNIKSKNNYLYVEYTDNGIGFNSNNYKKKPSFGMDLIHTLSDDLGSELKFQKPEKGTKVEFAVAM